MADFFLGPSPQPVSPPEVVAAAADWLVRLQCEPTQADLAQWRTWLTACPAHRLAWERLAAMTRTLDAHAAKVPAGAASVVVEQASQARLRRRRALIALLGLTATGMVVLGAGEPVPWRVWTANHRAGAGERRLLTLDDGTRLMLKTRSAVDTRFDAKARRIVLVTGEIWVESGQDAAGRPLIVETRSGRVIPIGTRFTVRELDGETTARVAVLDGAVEIQPRLGGEGLRLERGQQAEFDARGVRGTQAVADEADAWVNGMLVADNSRLDDFLAELGRYRRGVLRCDPAVAALRLTGTFPLQDTDKVLRLLEQLLPVRVSTRTAYWVTVGP